MFLIFGNVCSGKHHLGRYIKSKYHSDCVLYTAPSTKWNRTGFTEQFYKNYEKKNGCLPFLVNMIHDYDTQFRRAYSAYKNGTKIVIMNGGVRSVVYCTALSFKHQDLLDEDSYNLLEKLYFESFEYTVYSKFDASFRIITLRTNPHECRRRIESRKIKEEIDYYTRSVVNLLDSLYYENENMNFPEFSEEELIDYITHLCL